ncbi:MAG: universal stress protein [Vicinamibacterales bacterium]
MSAKPKPGRIIWAVDPFPEDKALQLKTLKAVAAFRGRAKLPIEPVAIVSPDGLRIPPGVFLAPGVRYQRQAQKILSTWVAASKVANVSSPTVLLGDTRSLRSSVSTLLRYARRTRASIVAVSTHARTRLDRFVMGSFAETLLLHADLPLLIVNPSVVDLRGVRRLLFPTDFSAGSRAAFQAILPAAQRRRATITIFTQCEYLVPATVEQIHSVQLYQQFFDRDVADRQLKGRAWAALARKRGVAAKVVVGQTPGYVPESILAVAKRTRADVIAMASHSGTVAATVLGSVARQVIRQARCPTWVIHTR